MILQQKSRKVKDSPVSQTVGLSAAQDERYSVAISRLLDQAIVAEERHRDLLLRHKRIRAALAALIPLADGGGNYDYNN